MWPDLKDANLALLSELNAQGVSIVILGDTIKQPEIARLAGVRFVSDYKGIDCRGFDKDHFITRPLAGREPEAAGQRRLLVRWAER